MEYYVTVATERAGYVLYRALVCVAITRIFFHGAKHKTTPIDCTCTVESRDYAPPPLCVLALDKSGEGACTKDPNISV